MRVDRIGFFFFLVCTIIFASVVYLGLVDDSPPAVIYSTVTDKDTYSPGETITIHISYCKYTNASAVNKPRIRGPISYDYGERLSNVGKGCGEADVKYQLPAGLLHGDYVIDTVIEYDVNFLFTRTVRWETNSFHVHDNDDH